MEEEGKEESLGSRSPGLIGELPNTSPRTNPVSAFLAGVEEFEVVVVVVEELIAIIPNPTSGEINLDVERRRIR